MMQRRSHESGRSPKRRFGRYSLLERPDIETASLERYFVSAPIHESMWFLLKMALDLKMRPAIRNGCSFAICNSEHVLLPRLGIYESLSNSDHDVHLVASARRALEMPQFSDPGFDISSPRFATREYHSQCMLPEYRHRPTYTFSVPWRLKNPLAIEKPASEALGKMALAICYSDIDPRYCADGRPPEQRLIEASKAFEEQVDMILASVDVIFHSWVSRERDRTAERINYPIFLDSVWARWPQAPP